MFTPDISGFIVTATGKYGNTTLRYRVDVATNRVTYILKRSRCSDLVFEDYAVARAKFDECCTTACGHATKEN